jgi:hypothetical protein
MKKILYLLTIMLIASAMVFGLNTKVSALMYVIDQKDVGNPFSWDFNQLIEYLESEGQGEIANILSEESWNNYTEPDLDSDGDEFPDYSGAGFVVIKSGGQIAFLTGDDIPLKWSDLPEGMNSISSVAVPEPSVLISLGIVLIALTIISRKRFNKS